MKMLTLLLALFAVSQSASAETVECHKIPSAKERLNCFDKSAPSKNVTAEKTPAAKNVMSDPKTFLDEEDARMKKVFKPICQHC